MSAYQWKGGYTPSVSAEEAGKFCEKLENTVGLTASNLVDASREESSLLHNEFEWDDSVAGEKYREQQARTIINHLIIVHQEEVKKEPVRAFFNIEGNRYENVNVIIETPSKYDVLLRQATSELNSFRRKYDSISELKKVNDAIDLFLEAI